MKKQFLYLCLSCPLLAVSSLFAQWENAEYLALGSLSGASSQRVLMYFDSSFNQLGYLTLETSAYEGANSIAYGNGIIPNGGNAPALVLQRVSSDTTISSRYVNCYKDPLASAISSGGQLPRDQSCTFIDLQMASSDRTPYVDNVVSLGSANTDGILLALVNRYNISDNSFISSFIYRYQVPESGVYGVPVYRVETETQAPRWDVKSGVEYKDFTTGIFFSPYDSEVTDQIACITADGTVHFYQVKDSKTNVIDKGTMSVAMDGKDVLSIWGGDNYSLFVLYSDYSVMEYDTISKEFRSSSFLSTDYGIIDMVKVSPVVVPEPAAYAALFGALALGVALLRRARR